MIGIVKEEDYVLVEYNPLYAKNIKWLRFKLNIPCADFGEYGIAWTFYKNRMPVVWISVKHTTYLSFSDFFKTELRKIKRKNNEQA